MEENKKKKGKRSLACGDGVGFPTLFNTIFHQVTPKKRLERRSLWSQKTSLFFSPNTPKEIQEYVKQRFGANIIRQHEKYLGLPSLVGRNKRNTFQQLKERVAHKLSVGKKSFCPWPVKRFWSRLLFKLSQLTLWVASFFQSPCVLSWTVWWVTFGGGRKMMSIKWPGWSGKSCVLRRQMVGWDLETWGLSTLPF